MTSHPVAELLLCFRAKHKDGRPMLFGFLVIFTHRLTELCILNAENIKKVYSRPIGVVPPPTQAHKIQTKPSFAIEKVIYAAHHIQLTSNQYHVIFLQVQGRVAKNILKIKGTRNFYFKTIGSCSRTEVKSPLILCYYSFKIFPRF